MVYIIILLSAIGFLLLSFVRYYYRAYKGLARSLETQKTLFNAERKKISADAKKRSGAVRWGKSIENFVPFMTDFPIPAEDVNFLGMPIDFIGFTDTDKPEKCRVHFIEVKSGKAFLSNKQINIKKAIEEGRVDWHEITVGSNTVK